MEVVVITVAKDGQSSSQITTTNKPTPENGLMTKIQHFENSKWKTAAVFKKKGFSVFPLYLNVILLD